MYFYKTVDENCTNMYRKLNVLFYVFKVGIRVFVKFKKPQKLNNNLILNTVVRGHGNSEAIKVEK